MLTDRVYQNINRAASDAGVSIATLPREPSSLPLSRQTTTAAPALHPASPGRTRQSIVLAFLIYVGGAGLTSVAQLAIAHLVGVSSYGTYSYVFAWMTVLAYGATLGFNIAILRFVSAYSATERWALARGVIQFAMKYSIMTAVGLSVVASAIVIASRHRLEPELATCMLLGLAAVPLMTFYLVGGALLRAFGGVISALLPERIARDGLLMLFVGLAALTTTWTIDATFITTALLASSVLTVALVIWTAIRLCPAAIRNASPSYAAADWWPPIIPIMITVALDTLVSRTGVMLLGWSGRLAEAGIFALAFNIAMLLALPRVAVSTIFAPMVAGLHARGDRGGLQKSFADASVTSFLGSALLAAPLLFQIEPLLRWFVPQFASAAPVVQILVLGHFFAAAAGPQQNILTMTGHERAAAALMVGNAVLTMIGCMIGIALHGAIGAAIATSVAIVVWNGAMAFYIWKTLGLTPGLVAALRGWTSRRL